MTHTQDSPLTTPSASQSIPHQESGHYETPTRLAPTSSQLKFADMARFHRTDAGNAELFAALFADKLRYDHALGRWLVWQEHWFSEDHDETVMRFARTIPRCRAACARSVADVDESEIHYKWAIRSENRSRLEAMLKLAQSERLIADSDRNWDSDPMLLGVKNGVVDLKTGKLRQGQQSDRITLHSNIALNPEAHCPRWRQFLKEIFGGDDALVAFVQRAVGYCLTGDTSEQVLFMCYGTGANGKSTFLDVVRFVLGPYAYNLPFSAFELKARSSIPNEIAALSGKRFVTAIETNESVELNEGRIKALTGSDPITARYLYREFFTFDPTGKFWLAFNHKPRVSDDSPGFWRRVVLIPFEQQFGEGRRDPHLLDTLKSEAPGILKWAIQGALKWQAQGLKAPEVVLKASDQYRRDSDTVGEFLEDRCTASPIAETTAASLWTEYERWAADNGERPLARKTLSQKLQARGFRKTRAGHDRTWTWVGISLNTRELETPVPALPPSRADADVKSPLLVN